MASRNRTPWKLKRGIYHATEFGEVTVTLTDTITISSLVATSNPLYVSLIKQSDGSTMACTYAAGTNIVTVTGAGTNIPCIYMAYGVKA
jgi:hypothetical protein